MHLGVHIMHFNWPDGTASIGPVLAATGRAAEAAGVTHLTAMDHYFQMEQRYPADDPMLEGYTTLGYLAAHTSTIQLGLLVTGVTYRHPGLLAKIVTTLDALSGGRAELGIGAAWYDREHRGLGVPFPSLTERYERLTETLEICLQMWSDDNGPWQGRHYELAETLCVPAPVSTPRPPIMIGGSGEKKTLRLVAQYADACNLFTFPPEEMARKLDVLRRHCEDVGRDYDQITKTLVYGGSAIYDGDGDGFLAEMEPYAKLGFERVVIGPPRGARPDTWIEQACAPVTPALAQLGP